MRSSSPGSRSTAEAAAHPRADILWRMAWTSRAGGRSRRRRSGPTSDLAAGETTASTASDPGASTDRVASSSGARQRPGPLVDQVRSWAGTTLVLVAEPDAKRRRYIVQSGIPNVLDRVPAEDTDIVGTLALVVECSGHEQAVLEACRMVRRRGEVVLVGVPWRRHTEIFAHELLSLVFHNYVVLRSGWEWELPRQATDFNPRSIHTGFDTALRWLADGRIRTEGLITQTDPRDAQQAYQDLLHRRAQGLFTVFDWTRLETAGARKVPGQ